MENMEQVLKNELSRSEEEKKRTFGIVNFLFMPSDVAIFLINQYFNLITGIDFSVSIVFVYKEIT